MANPTNPAIGTSQEVFWNASQTEIVGLSTAEKPTDRGHGTRFFEWDTREWYVFDGVRWRLLDRPAAEDATLARLQLLTLRELRGIRLLLAQSQMVAASTFEPLPELDGLGV